MVIGVFIFAFILVKWVALEKYITLPQLLDEKFGLNDLIVRSITGIAQFLVNACWVGGQLMAVAYLFDRFFGVPPVPMIIFTGIVYITYTYLGGLRAVVYTDVIQGIVQLTLTGAVFYLVFSELGQHGMALGLMKIYGQSVQVWLILSVMA